MRLFGFILSVAFAVALGLAAAPYVRPALAIAAMLATGLVLWLGAQVAVAWVDLAMLPVSRRVNAWLAPVTWWVDDHIRRPFPRLWRVGRFIFVYLSVPLVAFVIGVVAFGL